MSSNKNFTIIQKLKNAIFAKSAILVIFYFAPWIQSTVSVG